MQTGNFQEINISDIKIGKRLRKDLGDIKSLAKSIEEVGLLHPIVCTEKLELVAGHRRIKAFEYLKRQTISTHIISIDQIVKGEFHENGVRKPFTISEMVAIKKAVEPEIKAKNEEKRKKTQGRPKKKKETGAKTAPVTKNKTRDQVAIFCGVGRTTLKKAEKIVEAYEENPEKFGKLMENVDKGKTSIKYAYDVVSRAERHENPPELPDGEFDVIYADPPWQYNYKARGNPEFHYPLMNDAEICKIPVPSAKDSILFLWATNPKLIEALQVIAAWGYEYKTNLVWVKDKIGTGFYVRGQHEILLIAKKGNIPTPFNATRPPSVLKSPRRKHSQKPDEIYELIEQMYPNRQYLELFARQAREGWTSWGDEL